MRAFPGFAAPMFSLLLALSAVCPALADTFTGKCVRVLDGDTIEVMHNGARERIRLSGIDAPEKRQAFGQKAKEFTASLAYGQDVRVDWRKKDRYGRTIGEVTLANGRDVNYELVRAGYAWWYREYSHDPRLAELEQEARAQHAGLWSSGAAIPPWEFRHHTRTATVGNSVPRT